MSALQVPASSQYFGYDGPWQAVTVEVGGFQNGSTAGSQWTELQVMPGSYYSSWFLPPTYCQQSTLPGECGTGGIWNPGSQQTQSGEYIFYPPTLAEPGISATGATYLENLSFQNNNGVYYTVPNTSLAVVEEGNLTWPNGLSTNLELGILSLGAPQAQQSFSESTTNASTKPILGWLMPGYLFHNGDTPSYSFSMQLGSAALDYPISLWFGGYDKSRAIGPYTTWASDPPQLLDMMIGVELGGSPFDFASISGLLIDNTSTPAPVSVTPDSLSPGFHLPKQTCDKLAQYLPVQFDPSSGYYMWDASSSLFTKIITSPAYLGLVFPPATGSTGNVTIKLPFSLLNLTLDPIISGGDEPAPYFPCIPSQTEFVLGRAFLQGAFWATNWGTGVSWLSQAPGPGPSRGGLGTTEPVNIEKGDTDIDLFEGGSFFQNSWNNYWTPLPPNSQSANASSSNSTTAPSHTSSPRHSGLSTGAKIGIGVGVGVGGLLLLIAGGLLFWRRSKSHKNGAAKRTSEEGNVGDRGNLNDRYADNNGNSAAVGAANTPTNTGSPGEMRTYTLSEPLGQTRTYSSTESAGGVGFSHYAPGVVSQDPKYANYQQPHELQGENIDSAELDGNQARDRI